MEHSKEGPEMTTKSEGKRTQFSIGKMLLWTAIVAGGIAIGTASE